MVTESYIEAVERCIANTMKDFQNLAFNFNSESDLQARLFGCLRDEEALETTCAGHKIHLVHAEFPVLWKNQHVGRYYDLVVWEPQAFAEFDEDELYDLWGRKRADQAHKIRVLVAIEIKYLYSTTQMKPLSLDTSITEHNDMKKLLRGQNRYCYFLVFCDKDIKKATKLCQDRFKEMGLGFKRVREKEKNGSRFRILCASKDGCEIKLGFSPV
jgi:hypothetical protein